MYFSVSFLFAAGVEQEIWCLIFLLQSRAAMKLILLCVFGFSLDFAAKCQEDHYGLRGRSIRLSLSHRNLSHLRADVVWRRFYRQQFLANLAGVSPGYMNRMRLNSSDWSLTIHSLEESDSGLYEVLQNFEADTVAAFNLTVENSVSKPVVEVTPHDVNSSAGVCRVAVNCSVDGSWAAFDCEQSVCVKTRSSLSSINITVSVQDRVQCRVSNHVSRNHSQASIMCQSKQQSDPASAPALIPWVAVGAVGSVLALLLIMGLIAVVVKKRKSSKVYPQSSHVVSGRGTTTVIHQHKPDASHNPPGISTDSSAEATYDTPSRVQRVCPVSSVGVMTENQEKQRSGHDRTVKVRATVHQAEDPDSDPINTVYCKLGEI